jgi:glycosyltransferase involved in cell wall biosynthesis
VPNARVCMLVRNDVRTDYRVLKEARSVARAGYQVTVVGMNTYGPLEREQRDGFEIVRVPVERARTPWGKVNNLFVRTIRRMADYAAGLQAAAYHAHDSDCILPAAMAKRRVPGSKLIYDAHEVGFWGFRESFSSYPFKLPGIQYGWSLWNDRLVREEVDTVITVNEPLAAVQAAHYGIPTPRVVMNCPPRYTIRPQAKPLLATRLGIDPATPIAVAQGMYTVGRGDYPPLEMTVRSAPLLDHGCVIAIIGNVGSAEAWAPLRELAQEPAYASRVFILPPVPPTTLLDYTSGAQVGLIPFNLSGLARFSLPNKLFEYMATGLPIVSPDLPVIRSILEKYGCGVLCDFTTPESVAAAINGLLADPQRYAAMSAASLHAAEEYNWETQERVLIGLYHEVIGSPEQSQHQPAVIVGNRTPVES